MAGKTHTTEEFIGEAGDMWDLEKLEKRKLSPFKCQPTISFSGSKTECFTQIK